MKKCIQVRLITSPRENFATILSLLDNPLSYPFNPLKVLMRM